MGGVEEKLVQVVYVVVEAFVHLSDMWRPE